MTFREIPLNKLKLSPANMRQGDVDVSDLVASFSSPRATILQNLRVTVEKNEAGKATGHFLVQVGGRRYRAAMQMAEAGKWKKTQPIPCVVCEDEARALEESITENSIRLDPHPAARFKAFKALADTGMSVEAIAERFGVSPLIIQRRLKLAVVSPRLFELFERDEITFEQMQAFTVSDDHAAQEDAFFNFPEHSRWPHDIKRRLTAGEASTADSGLFQFVGADAYTAAGGVIRQDLFGRAEGDGYIGDMALLEKLALERLEAEAEAVRAEGWKWVEARVTFDYTAANSYGRVYPKPVAPTPEVQEQIDALTEEAEAIDGEDEDGAERLSAIENELDALESGREEFTAEQKAIAGCVVTVSPHRGGLTIERGLVAKEDAKAAKALDRESMAAGDDGQASDMPAGASAKRADGLSASLVENLTAHRTLALRAALMDSPRVAMVAVVHRLAVLTFYKAAFGGTPDSALVLSGSDYQTDPMRYGDDLATSKAVEAIKARRAAIKASLPAEADDLWDFLLASTDAELMELQAFCASQQLYAVQHGHFRNDSRRRSADGIARAMGFDMADWWEADAEFFKRIPKDEITRALKEGADVEDEGLAKLKKGELAERAAQALDGKRWVPDVIRTPPGADEPEAEPEAEREAA